MSEVSILVLEDDQEMRETLEDVLLAEGYRVVTAATGEQAVQVALTREFDLVVTDVRLPGIDGLQALEEMRKHLGEVESLVVTGYCSEEDSIRALRQGARDYLSKPFKLDDFLAAVEALLARRREVVRRQNEERLLRHSLLWATQLLADRGLRAAQERARRLAERLGMSAAVSESLQLAVLMSGIPRETEGFGPTLPAQVEHILAHLEERWDGTGVPQGLVGTEIPLEARVAAAALRAHDPTGLDPDLLTLLEKGEAAGEPAPPPTLPGSQARGLVSLGRALAEAGSQASARAAFEQVAQAGGPTRERLDALHALARLAQEPGEGQEWLNRALSLAESLGPLHCAASHLDAGVQLRSAPLLRRSLSLYARLRHETGAARARLALAGLGEDLAELELEQAAGVLAREPVAGDADWLLPWLLERSWLVDAAGEPGQAGLTWLGRRLVRENPRGVFRLLREGRLSTQARRRLARCLRQLEGSGAQGLLALLAQDADPEVRAAAQVVRGEPAAETRPSGPELRIYCLGSLEVYWGEERVPESRWKSRKVKHLLAMLAAWRGRPVSEDRLLETFWPEELERGRKNLNWTLSTLRKALGHGELISRNLGGIALNPAIPRWHDLEQLEDLLTVAGQELRAGSLTRPQRYHALIELYRGLYLEECYLDWALELRTRVETQLTPTLLALAGHFQAQEQFLEALEYLHCLLVVDPLHQEGCLATMACYRALRRPEQAVRQFKLIKERLQRELQMEPSLELLEAHQRALLEM